MQNIRCSLLSLVDKNRFRASTQIVAPLSRSNAPSQTGRTPAIEQLPQDVEEKLTFVMADTRAAPLVSTPQGGRERERPRRAETEREVSAIEQLPQNLVHGLAVLRSLRRRIALRLYRRDVRGRRRRRHQRAGLAAALAHALLQEVAEGFAEPVGHSATAAGAAAAWCVAARAAGQSAQHAAEAAAAAEQAEIGRAHV